MHNRHQGTLSNRSFDPGAFLTLTVLTLILLGSRTTSGLTNQMDRRVQLALLTPQLLVGALLCLDPNKSFSGDLQGLCVEHLKNHACSATRWLSETIWVSEESFSALFFSLCFFLFVFCSADHLYLFVELIHQGKGTFLLAMWYLFPLFLQSPVLRPVLTFLYLMPVGLLGSLAGLFLFQICHWKIHKWCRWRLAAFSGLVPSVNGWE